MKDIPQNVSQSFKDLNPHLYLVGAVETKVTQPVAAPALARGSSKLKGRKRCAVVLVTFTAHRRRILDDDNNVASIKPLRDAVASHLQVDDGDSRIKWECGQCSTTGEEGVIITIQTI